MHPKPKRLMMRDDGDGGLDITVTTAAGGFEVYALTETEAAMMIRQLAEFLSRRFMADSAEEADAAVQKLRRFTRGVD